MRYVVDSSWWRRSTSSGETLVAGSPVRVMRLDVRAKSLLDSLESGDDVTGGSPSLIERLLDNGAIHPVIDRGGESTFRESDVSVVIPVHDERHDEIVDLVRSLSAASRVIVVDDGSTFPMAAVPGAEVLRRDVAGGPGAARNAGLTKVDTELVLFVDADVIWDPDAWGSLLAHFDDERVAAVAPRVSSDPGPSLLARYERSNSPLDLGPEPARVRAGTRVSYVPAAAIMMRTNVVRSIGGFDETLRYGEDVDLVWRLDSGGSRCRYEASVTVFHRPRASMIAAWKQRVSYGSAAAALHARHPGAVAPLRLNRWSAVSWALAAAGHAVVGSGTALASTTMLVRTLNNVESRVPIAMRLAGRGNLHAGRLIASALTRTWWPLTMVACLFSRRARRVAMVAAVVPNVATWLSTRPDVDPMRYVMMRVADDVAYGTGVWKGAIEERDPGALLPVLD
ncbi:MAG: mycofactocin biosynthesis glycosyltransferase MftF [Ilumatobacteraceae bacterium]|jgi:mycofactocin system glycosyltransferase|nr:mycofactocin biosynthesis glycosyltransferase MftF [Ilumatobacteraceae bacterium]